MLLELSPRKRKYVYVYSIFFLQIFFEVLFLSTPILRSSICLSARQVINKMLHFRTKEQGAILHSEREGSLANTALWKPKSGQPGLLSFVWETKQQSQEADKPGWDPIRGSRGEKLLGGLAGHRLSIRLLFRAATGWRGFSFFSFCYIYLWNLLNGCLV